MGRRRVGVLASALGVAALGLVDHRAGALDVEVYGGNRACSSAKRISDNDWVQMRFEGTIHAGSKTGVVGKVFDSSARLPGELLNVTLGRGLLCLGWERGLVNLCEGARATIVIEPELAYG